MNSIYGLYVVNQPFCDTQRTYIWFGKYWHRDMRIFEPDALMIHTYGFGGVARPICGTDGELPKRRIYSVFYYVSAMPIRDLIRRNIRNKFRIYVTL